jgi:hypothetical protein
MNTMKKKYYILTIFAFLSTFVASCEHVATTSTPPSNQVEISAAKPAEFKFYVGSQITPIQPLISAFNKSNEVNKDVEYLEDTNSEIQTLSQFGLRLNKKTGVISGTPVENGIGTSTITIVVKNKNEPIQNSPNYKINITTALETCPVNPLTVNAAEWKVIHGSTVLSNQYTFRYSHLENDNKLTCVYEKKQLTNSDLFLVLEKQNKTFNPAQLLQKHADEWTSNSANSYYCQPKSGEVTACPFY